MAHTHTDFDTAAAWATFACVSLFSEVAGCDDYDYVEAHGTGTKLGDPIEVWALTEALSTRRKARGIETLSKSMFPLYLTYGNSGHHLRNKEIVPSRYAEKPTSLVDWESTPLVLATK
eukprot:6024566-Amphidinium_carterae.1